MVEAARAIAAVVLLTTSLTPQIGIASQYSPNVMQRVVANRQAMGHLPDPLPDVAGCIAVLECDEIGNIWLVRLAGGEWKRYLVADCAQANDGTREWFAENGILLEFSGETARELGIVGKGVKVEVLH